MSLVVDGIGMSFGGLHALRDIGFRVDEGEMVALIGPNGAGKSTLIKILLGLLRASSGRGRVLEFEMGTAARQIRANVGYMPEDDCFLYGLTGVESVQVSARLSGFPSIEGLRRSHEILDFCGLGQERYRTVETYSTGMRQKLRFAQAIVHDPPLLILDEPTSGLDPEEREIMLRRIKRLARDHGKAVVICTHILPDVQAVSDAVVILARGRVRVSDRLKELSRPAEPSVRVRVIGSTENFMHQLTASGLTVEPTDNGSIIVRGEERELINNVWSVARKNDVAIRSLAPSRNSLEEIFLSAVQEQPHGRA